MSAWMSTSERNRVVVRFDGGQIGRAYLSIRHALELSVTLGLGATSLAVMANQSPVHQGERRTPEPKLALAAGYTFPLLSFHPVPE